MGKEIKGQLLFIVALGASDDLKFWGFNYFNFLILLMRN